MTRVGLEPTTRRLRVWDQVKERKEYFRVDRLHGIGPITWDPAGRKVFFVSNPVE